MKYFFATITGISFYLGLQFPELRLFIGIGILAIFATIEFLVIDILKYYKDYIK